MTIRPFTTLCAALLLALLPLSALAQTRHWVQVEAHPTLRTAEEWAARYEADFDNVAGFRLSGGWYALALGPYATAEDAAAVRRQLLASRMIPRDAYVAQDSAYGPQFWPAGAPTAALPEPQPEPMRQQPAPQARHVAPQVEMAPEPQDHYASEPVQDELDLPHHAHHAAIARARENAPRPTAQQQRPQPAPVAEASQHPRTPGTPSPETLARLREAVSRQPAQPYQRRAPEAAPSQQHPQERGSRFGLGALINKMAGSGAEATAARHQPPVTAYDDDPEQRAEQERIEIPAFLRRQAN